MATLEKVLPNMLLQVSVRELHNSMANPPEEGDIKEVRRKIIILSSSTQC